MLTIGISEVNITPAPGRRMAGMAVPPVGKKANWNLYGRTIVFDDGIDRAALICLDLLLMMPSTVAEFRQAVTAGTGLKPENVMITCSHTHRAPFMTALMDVDTDFEYVDFVREKLVVGMAAAWSARRPARIKQGQIEAPGWTFNRRQVYKSDLGEQVGTQGPHWVPDFIRNEGPEDNLLQVLRFEGLDGVPLGGLVNFACHTTVMGLEEEYSSDYAGPLTELLSEQLGGIFAFVQGTAGNLWCIDRSRDIDLMKWMGAEHARRMAKALTDKAVSSLEQGRYLEDSGIAINREILPIPQRQATTEQVKLAKWYLEEARDGIDEVEFSRQIYGHDYTFYGNEALIQEWFAREMIGMWEWQRRAGYRQLVEDVEVQVIRIGNLALVGYPGEIFCEFGLKTRAESPFAVTIVAELANGWHGYIPTVEAFAHGGYEPRLGYQSRLVPEAGDAMTAAALRLLKRLNCSG